MLLLLYKNLCKLSEKTPQQASGEPRSLSLSKWAKKRHAQDTAKPTSLKSKLKVSPRSWLTAAAANRHSIDEMRSWSCIKPASKRACAHKRIKTVWPEHNKKKQKKSAQEKAQSSTMVCWWKQNKPPHTRHNSSRHAQTHTDYRLYIRRAKRSWHLDNFTK